MEGIHDHNSPEAPLSQPVHRGSRIHQSQLFEKGVKGALHSQHLLHSNRSHKRREDERHKNQGGQRAFQGKPIAMRQQSKRKGDQERGQRTRHSKQECIPKPFKINRVHKNLRNVIQSQPAITINERFADHHNHREKKKYGKEQGNYRCQNNSLSTTHSPSSARRRASL